MPPTDTEATITGDGSGESLPPATNEARVFVPIEERVAQLERQQSLQTTALRRILENDLEGANGAAGAVVALEGGQTSVDVKLGKSGAP